MSNLTNDLWIEAMWAKYSPAYLKECNANNWQADLSDFWLWLEERDMIPESEYEDG